MIAGIEIPTKGMCYIGDSSLVKHRQKYLSSIGYCSQENTVFENFSGIQMLELMGRLRGIPKHLLSSHVSKWLKVMGNSKIIICYDYNVNSLCKIYFLNRTC